MNNDNEAIMNPLKSATRLAQFAFIAAFAHSLEGSIDFDDVAPTAKCLGDEQEAACDSEKDGK